MNEPASFEIFKLGIIVRSLLGPMVDAGLVEHVTANAIIAALDGAVQPIAHFNVYFGSDRISGLNTVYGLLHIGLALQALIWTHRAGIANGPVKKFVCASV